MVDDDAPGRPGALDGHPLWRIDPLGELAPTEPHPPTGRIRHSGGTLSLGPVATFARALARDAAAFRPEVIRGY